MSANDAKSILVIVIGFILIGYLNPGTADLSFLVYVGLGLGVLSLMFEKVGSLIVKGWMKLGHAMGFVMSKVLLSIIFFVFLVPLAILFRMFNKNPLQLKNPSDSVFITRNHAYGPKDLENIW